MWIKLSELTVQQIKADQLKSPANPDSPLELYLFQRESSTAFFVSRNKKVLAKYIEKSSRVQIPKRKWTKHMQSFAEQSINNVPNQKSVFKITILGWLLLLVATALLGYIAYKEIQAPAKKARFEQKLEKAATIHVGEIYFGHFEEFKESKALGRISSKIGFGWFKVVKIEHNKYYISKGIQMSKKSIPKERLNNKEFEQGSTPVTAKEITAYNKTFESADRHIVFYLTQKWVSDQAEVN